MRIEVINNLSEKNILEVDTREVYSFNLFNLNAVFVEFHKEIRPKRKRNWRIVDYWSKYDSRKNNIEEPELPEIIKSQALTEVFKLVKIKTWNEYNGK